MAEPTNEKAPTNTVKSSHALREEKILAFWKEKGIFDKSLEKGADGKAPKGEYVFYEGPPTANGLPGIHHLEARAFKDAIPRYKTMRGYHVRRKGGWDTHGLPVELQVEKELGLKSKKEIETYGIGAFNEKCKESVWKYVHEWEDFTNRIGYWVDLKDPYITYKSKYIEAVWNVIKTAEEKKLLYKDYKVVPWCPRCGTGLSSHELAQGYETVKDLTITVKFKITNPEKLGYPKDSLIYLLAWTTTPWTLPGNVGLAIGRDIQYIMSTSIKDGKTENLIVAADRAKANNIESGGVPVTSEQLSGLSYEPLYPFLKDNVKGAEKEKLTNAFKVYAADFVTTADGTGIVHIAPMYGQDDFEVGTKVGLPKYHLVNDDGTFKKEAGLLGGAFVKDPNTDVTIIKDLAGRGLLFSKEKYEHTYPFCWRCHTPLIYFARDSWYIRMSELRKKLVKENEGIHWEPEHIKEGRFGEWLREIKDWAISRERYWGTPLPVWTCDTCHENKVIGSVADIAQKPKNTYFVMRHGQAENNVLEILDSSTTSTHHLTEKGRGQVLASAKRLKSAKIDYIYYSPVLRTKETAEIVRETLGVDDSKFIVEEKIREYNAGVFENKSVHDLGKACLGLDRWTWRPERGEDYMDIKKRTGEFLYEIEGKYERKNILIVTHETPAAMLCAAAAGYDIEGAKVLRKSGDFIGNAEVRKVDFKILPHNKDFELDLHRPFIDSVKLKCSCGGVMTRAKEVMDVWFDSGSMPFAQDHEIKEEGAGRKKLGIWGKEKVIYPADFISEAIDQTRGWFYTLHAIGTIMGKGKAYKNVICLGHILDGEGKKMSKSVGNVVNPWTMMDKYGVDALRFWMYSVNQPGDSKNFEEKTVDEVVKKVFNLVSNVVSFYKLYEVTKIQSGDKDNVSTNVLDRWIISRLNQLIGTVTTNLDDYKFMEPTRAIRDFIADLSQWYLQSSRDRFKGDGSEKDQALSTMRYVLITLAKTMAPFTPFFSEFVYSEMGGELESVHLEEWPKPGKVDAELLEDMETTRKIVEVALSLRSFKKIGVRQPLSQLSYEIGETKRDIREDLRAIIKEKLNVKNVDSIKIDEDLQASITENNGNLLINSGGLKVRLNIEITPSLKEEGNVRELIRAIQDLRKEKGLTVSDKIVLKIETDEAGQQFIRKHESSISVATSLKSVSFTTIAGESQNIAGMMMKLGI